ncbi:hypothetical protein ABH920_007175, partial [Catenulispora sp. EB89]
RIPHNDDIARRLLHVSVAHPSETPEPRTL